MIGADNCQPNRFGPEIETSAERIHPKLDPDWKSSVGHRTLENVHRPVFSLPLRDVTITSA